MRWSLTEVGGKPEGLNQISIADTYLSLAQVYTVLGRFDQCTDYAKSALDIYDKLNDKKGIMGGKSYSWQYLS